MQIVVDVATHNPFCAIITNSSSGEVFAKVTNSTPSNPLLHDEIVCLNNYVNRIGNKNWSNLFLYTTGQPCPMCMSALIWAGIGGVVYESSVATLKNFGFATSTCSTRDIDAASNFIQTQLTRGVLEARCDTLFLNRRKV